MSRHIPHAHLQLVKGTALIKFKTNPVDPLYAPYWEGRSRFFEFQVRAAATLQKSSFGRIVALTCLLKPRDL